MTESTPQVSTAPLQPYVLTRSGQKVFLLAPTAHQIHPKDIAWHLSHMARFNGATKIFYSVAQHTVLCARLGQHLGLPKHVRLGALLHDAPEAYMGDLVSPLKAALGPETMARFHEIEKRLLVSIYTRAGLDWASPKLDDAYWKQIKQLDLWMLGAERATLMPPDPNWEPEFHPDLPRVNPWPAEIARANWLKEFNTLSSGRAVL